MITWADVVKIAPALSVVPVPTQDLILAFCVLQLSADTWGTKYDMGLTYLAAHLGTLWLAAQSGGGAVAGLVRSETVGQVSRTWAVPAELDPSGSDLDLTTYGQIFKRLIRGLLKARIPLVL